MARDGWDEALLVAYVDGELDIDARERVQRILATSPDAQHIVERLQASADASRDAFAAILNEPVPETMTAAVRSAEPDAASDRVLKRPLLAWTWSAWWRLGAVPVAAAGVAAVVLAVLAEPPRSPGVLLAAGPENPVSPEALADLAELLEQGGNASEGRTSGGEPWRIEVFAPIAGMAGCRTLLYGEAGTDKVAGLVCPTGDGLWSVSAVELGKAEQ